MKSTTATKQAPVRAKISKDALQPPIEVEATVEDFSSLNTKPEPPHQRRYEAVPHNPADGKRRRLDNRILIHDTVVDKETGEEVELPPVFYMVLPTSGSVSGYEPRPYSSWFLWKATSKAAGLQAIWNLGLAPKDLKVPDVEVDIWKPLPVKEKVASGSPTTQEADDGLSPDEALLAGAGA